MHITCERDVHSSRVAVSQWISGHLVIPEAASTHCRPRPQHSIQDDDGGTHKFPASTLNASIPETFSCSSFTAHHFTVTVTTFNHN